MTAELSAIFHASAQEVPNLLTHYDEVAVEIKGQPIAAIMDARRVTADVMNLNLHRWHSIFYLLLPTDQIKRLKLARIGYNQLGWIMTESIEAAEGVTTGISAADRAQTISRAICTDAQPAHLTTPGHVFPAVLDDGAGHAASVLYRCLQPHVRSLLWMPILSDDDGTPVRNETMLENMKQHKPSQTTGQAGRRTNIPYVKL